MNVNMRLRRKYKGLRDKLKERSDQLNDIMGNLPAAAPQAEEPQADPQEEPKKKGFLRRAAGALGRGAAATARYAGRSAANLAKGVKAGFDWDERRESLNESVRFTFTSGDDRREAMIRLKDAGVSFAMQGDGRSVVLMPKYWKEAAQAVQGLSYTLDTLEKFDNVVLSPLLQEILAEQDEYDARQDPKGRAPEAAFGQPPVPPSGDPEGLAQHMPDPGSLPPEQPAGLVSPPLRKEVKVPVRIIVTQNNNWWELAWKNWLQFLAQGASGARWNLDHWGARIPGGQPPDVREYLTKDQGPPAYYSNDPATNVFYVKGWQPKRFADELDYIAAMDVAQMPLISPKPPEEEETEVLTVP
jgi:hypothetical protein